MPETAFAEPIVDSAPPDMPELDSGAPDLGTEASPEPGDTPTGEPQAAEGEPAKPGPAVLGGKWLSPSAKSALAPIKAANPDLHKQIVRALFAQDRLGRDLPGGFDEISTLRQQIEQYGGEEGLKDLQAAAGELNSLREMFVKGDQQFINELTFDPELQAAFVKQFPGMMAKYREMHADGFNSMVARAVAGDMAANQVAIMLTRLEYAIGENPVAKQELQRLFGYVQSWNELASKEPEAPKIAPAAQPDNGLENRERTLTAREWGGEASGIRESIFAREWARLGGDKLNDEQAADIKELYASRLAKAVAAEGLKEKAQRHLMAGDKQGYLRLMRSLMEKNIPQVLGSVMARRAGAAPRKATPPASGRPAAQPTAPGKAAAGFTWIGKVPANGTVDWSTTGSGMYSQGRAILKDGRKVQWKSAFA